MTKQEAKIQGTKATSENMQSNDKKNDLEKTSASNQSSNATSTTVEANGIDNEDSINLTIGEDEENLLVEEVRIGERGKEQQFSKFHVVNSLLKKLTIMKFFLYITKL